MNNCIYLSCMSVGGKILFTAWELDLDLLPLLFETQDSSLTCFFASPVTTSNIVGSSLIILNSRFLHYKCQNMSRLMHEKTYNITNYQEHTQTTKWCQEEHWLWLLNKKTNGDIPFTWDQKSYFSSLHYLKISQYKVDMKLLCLFFLSSSSLFLFNIFFSERRKRKRKRMLFYSLTSLPLSMVDNCFSNNLSANNITNQLRYSSDAAK